MTSSTVPNPQPYQLFMLLLCLFALGILIAQSFFSLEPTTRSIFDYADNFVCIIFLIDFVVSLFRAPKKWTYFFTWGWIDLASSIPMFDPLRWGRVARITRIFRLIRGVRATRILAAFILERRSEDAFLAAALISLLLVVFSSVAILHVEIDAEGNNIKTAEDALWWAFATITTVGYGDRYPVTTEGRFVGVLLMAAGVGLIGTFSGSVAAWFLEPAAKNKDIELEDMRQELITMRRLLEEHADRRNT